MTDVSDPNSPAPASAPDTVAPSPVAPAEITPVVPDSAPAAQPETPPASEPAKTDAVTNVLGDTKSEPSKSEPASTETKTKGSTEKAPETIAELPTYDIKLPENVQFDKTAVDAFTKLVGEIETGKLDHNAFNEKAQSLIDMHLKAVDRLNEYYVGIHEKQKTDWLNEFRNDPVLGKEKVSDTVKSVRDAIDTYGGNKVEIKTLRDQMTASGYGNYTPLIRLISNMQAKIDSYTKESTGGIVPGQSPAPVKVKDYQRFYGN